MNAANQVPAINGFTLPAFLCWFGGAGYLLHSHSSLIMPVILLIAMVSGMIGSSLIYAVLFKFLLPHEQVLTQEATRMDGVVARVSDEIRPNGGVGEYHLLADRRTPFRCSTQRDRSAHSARNRGHRAALRTRPSRTSARSTITSRSLRNSTSPSNPALQGKSHADRHIRHCWQLRSRCSTHHGWPRPHVSQSRTQPGAHRLWRPSQTTRHQSRRCRHLPCH